MLLKNVRLDVSERGGSHSREEKNTILLYPGFLLTHHLGATDKVLLELSRRVAAYESTLMHATLPHKGTQFRKLLRVESNTDNYLRYQSFRENMKRAFQAFQLSMCA
jgi:hypothetical protein